MPDVMVGSGANAVSSVAPVTAPMPVPAPGGPGRTSPFGLMALLGDPRFQMLAGGIGRFGRNVEESGQAPEPAPVMPLANPAIVQMALQMMQQLAMQPMGGLPPGVGVPQRRF